MKVDKRIAIVLARAGSTRLPNKNMLKIGGMTLTERAVEAGIGAGLSVILSSNSKEILEHVNSRSVTNYLRSESNSNNFSTSESAVRETIDEFDIPDSTEIILLQPTSPMRTSDTVKRFLTEWETPINFGKFDSAFSVTQESNEYWVNIDTNLVRLSKLINAKETFTRSQDRPPLYKENGAIYLTRAGNIRSGERFVSGNKYVFLCNKFESIDIDTAEDLKVAEAIYEQSKRK